MIIGIDPGLKGGIATEEAAYLMPISVGKIDAIVLTHLLRTRDANVLYVEKVGARPGQGVCSMFNFGFGCGVIEGVALSLGYLVRYVTPQQWKKVVLGTRYPHDKNGAIAFCKDNYAHINLCPGRLRVPSDGLADAICIGHYGRIMEE